MRKSLVTTAAVAALALSDVAWAIVDESHNSITDNAKELNGTTVSLPPAPPVETENNKRPHKTTSRTVQPPAQGRSSEDTAARALETGIGIGLGIGLGGLRGFGRGGDRGGLRGGDRGGDRGGIGGGSRGGLGGE